MRISLFVGLGVLGIKVAAYLLSHSQALLADVAESVVHQLAVGIATYLAYLQQKPADQNHPHGHGKFGFVSSGIEGMLILTTGVVILLSSIGHVFHPVRIEASVLSMVLVALSLLINGVLGFLLVRQGKKNKSLLLEANGHHVFTDSWTSLGALAALLLVKLTGNAILDPLCSCAIALVIIYSGAHISWRAFHGLTDGVNPQESDAITKALTESTLRQGGRVHDIQIRHDSLFVWVQAHVTFAGDETLRHVHDRLTVIEDEMTAAFPEVRALLHAEPEDHEDAGQRAGG
jgi:cation diffusion facilitator family transporter